MHGLVNMALVDGPHPVLGRQMEVGQQFIHALRECLFGKPMPFGDLLHGFFRPANQAVTVENHVQLQQWTG